jgi:uncharacterized membrane protein
MEDKKDRPFLKAHNAQALAWGVVGVIVNTALSFVFGLGCVTAVIFLIISIVWAVKANKGEYIEIPVLTKFVKDQGWA